MLSAIRRHVSPATVMAFVALIFAMTGGAFAVTNHGGGSGAKASASMTASAAKKYKSKAGARGPAGPKGATGATGATGPAGPAGPAGLMGPAGGTGPQGSAGTNGTNGENGKQGEPGKNGKGVISTPFSGTEEPVGAGEPCKKAGGDTVEVEDTGKKSYVCNGGAAGGSFPETLPEGKTEKGTWGVVLPASETESYAFSPISFSVPLEVKPKELNYVSSGETIVGKCEGTAEEPTAANGYLCVYEAGHSQNLTKALGNNLLSTSVKGATKTFSFVKTGALVDIHDEEATGIEANIWGTWAVTAE
jgi:Collagen triple helix repeat (20 copies)